MDRINLDDGYVRYEIGSRDANTSKHHHHHLICLSCGKVISFEDDLLEELEKKITDVEMEMQSVASQYEQLAKLAAQKEELEQILANKM